MRSPYLQSTLVSIVLGLLIALAGIFGLIWPLVPRFRSGFIYWLDSGTWTIPLLGLGLFLLGCLLVAGALIQNRRHYYHVRMGDRTVQVDESVIEGYLDEYWRTLFPESQVTNRIRIKREKIYITSDLPHLPFRQQKELLGRIDTDLSEIFSRVLDYRKEFWFTASFDEAPTEEELPNQK